MGSGAPWGSWAEAHIANSSMSRVCGPPPTFCATFCAKSVSIEQSRRGVRRHAESFERRGVVRVSHPLERSAKGALLILCFCLKRRAGPFFWRDRLSRFSRSGQFNAGTHAGLCDSLF